VSLIIVSGTTTSITSVDASNTYLVESGGVLDILNGGLVSGLISVVQGGELVVSAGGTALSATIDPLAAGTFDVTVAGPVTGHQT
jgi:hypothetical protein